MNTEFETSVLRIVQSIPFGKVMSYGQVSAYIGMPESARQVGWAMQSIDQVDNFPWWRVLNNAGKISIKENLKVTSEMQRRALEDEDVEVSDELTLDIERYRYRPDEETLRNYGIMPEVVAELLMKYKEPDADPQLSIFDV